MKGKMAGAAVTMANPETSAARYHGRAAGTRIQRVDEVPTHNSTMNADNTAVASTVSTFNPFQDSHRH